MTYGDFNDLNRRTFSDKLLLDKTFNITNDPKKDGYQRALTSIFYRFLDKKTTGRSIENENVSNKELAEQLQKPIIRKLNKTKVHSSFIGNICGADLADFRLCN